MAFRVTSYPFAEVAAAMLWWLGMFQPGQAAGEESRLRVVSTPAGLSVEAHGVSLEEALREVGAQVRFAVVAKETTYPVVDLSIKDAALEDVLQQLLRGASYAIVYQEPRGGGKEQGGERISQIRLLSPSTAIAATQAPEPRQQGQEGSQLSPQSQEALARSLGAALADQSGVAVFGKEGWTGMKEKYEEDTPAIPETVADLLKAQVLHALEGGGRGQALSDSEQSSSGDADEPAETVPPSGTIRSTDLGEDAQRTMQETLAITQQAAQRNLATLVEGLAEATNAAANSLAGQETSGR